MSVDAAGAAGAAGAPGLDSCGWPVEGAVRSVRRAILDGAPVLLRATLRWPLPAFPENVTPCPPHWPSTGGGRGEARTTLWVTDETLTLGPDEAVLRPPSLSVGIGAGRGVGADEVISLVERALQDAGLSPRCVAQLATVDAKAGEPGLLAAADRLRLPLRTCPADVLAAVEVPNPSDAARAAVGTPSVAEAAALTAAGGDGWLVVPKVRSVGTDGAAGMATAAVARRRARGRLMTMGHGPGVRTASARTRETQGRPGEPGEPGVPETPESPYSKECQ